MPAPCLRTFLRTFVLAWALTPSHTACHAASAIANSRCAVSTSSSPALRFGEFEAGGEQIVGGLI